MWLAPGLGGVSRYMMLSEATKNTKKYLSNSLYSLVGALLLALFAFIRGAPSKDVFRKRNILVLGTGPTLDRLDQDLIDGFDVVVFLNAAIRIAERFDFSAVKKVFFNTDSHRFCELRQDLERLDKTWCYIFIPIHLHLFRKLFFFCARREAFFLLPRYRLGHWRERHVPRSFLTVNVTPPSYTRVPFVSGRIPYLPYTVAFSAFYFFISCEPQKLSYLGCDFDTGRSCLVSQPSASFEGKKLNLWMRRLKMLSNKYNIQFEPAI